MLTKRVSLIAFLMVAAVTPLSSILAQTGMGAQKTTEKPAAETATESGAKAPAKPEATAPNTVAQSGANDKSKAVINSESTPPNSATDAKGDGSANQVAIKSDTSKVSNSADAPLTDVYRVGVGDVLDIRLLNTATVRSTLFTVIDGGLIEFPLTGGTIKVAGATADEIQSLITAELNRRAIQENAQVAVAVRQFSSHTVILTGLVGSPGTKILRREAIPLYVILAEAQPRFDAARATIIRSDGTTLVFDLVGDASLNTLVLPGDVINVAARPQEFYYIGGRINYPGQKQFQPGMTLLQAVLAAGGLIRPSEGVVELSREGTDAHLTTARFILRDIKAGSVKDPKLQAGDRIEVIH